MNPHLQRGLLLYEQSRYQLAEPEFRQAVGLNPDDAYTRALLGLTLSHQERYDEAEAEITQALQSDPGMPFVHYARALVLNERNDLDGALAAVSQAIELDPEDPDFRALQAQILINQRKWSEALSAAENGLSQDPEHVSCTNLRAIALVKLGRKAEAGQTIDAALAKNPENSVTHANQGWTLLHAGQHEKALEHFRESLRLDPENEWARQGTVEALKARYFLYSILLKYFLWMSRLSSQKQWAVVIGGIVGMRILGSVSRSRPELTTYIFPIQILYLIFVFLTWTAEPLFNLLLRLNKFGRLVLSDRERVASNWIGSFVGLALLSFAAGLAYPGLFVGAAVFGFGVLPLAAVFKCPAGWPRWAMITYSAAVIGPGVLAFVLILSDTVSGGVSQIRPSVGGLMGFFALGIVLAGWVANILIMQRVRR